MNEHLNQILTLLLGAAGFWKIAEVLIRFRSDRKLKRAQTRHYSAQSESEIVSNWVQWSEKLEARIKELEAEAEQMRETINAQSQLIMTMEEQLSEQTDLITSFKDQIGELVTQNTRLTTALEAKSIGS